MIWAMIFAGLAAGCGCTTASQPHARWVSNQGGLVADARILRAQAAADRLIFSSPASQISIHVLKSPSVAAYSFSDGNIYLTSTLVDRMTDDELSAVVAHEMGHLCHDARWANLSALRGVKADGLDVESRADTEAVQLLDRSGISKDTMIQMLRKVESAEGISNAGRSAIANRIDRLTAVAKQSSSAD